MKKDKAQLAAIIQMKTALAEGEPYETADEIMTFAQASTIIEDLENMDWHQFNSWILCLRAQHGYAVPHPTAPPRLKNFDELYDAHLAILRQLGIKHKLDE